MLKLKEKKQHVRNASGLRKNAKAKKNLKLVKKPTIIEAVVDDGKPTLTELKRNQCKWAVGENEWKEITFCGEKRHEKSPYCLEHYKAGIRKFNPDGGR